MFNSYADLFLLFRSSSIPRTFTIHINDVNKQLKFHNAGSFKTNDNETTSEDPMAGQG